MTFALWWSEWKHYRIAALVTALSLIVFWWGWHVSMGAEGVPFARSGALVCALSVAFIFWRYAEILARGRQGTIARATARLKAMNLREPISEATRKQITTKLEAATRRIERNITWVQGLVLLFGTLVWGFGDLLYQYQSLPWSEIGWKLYRLGGNGA